MSARDILQNKMEAPLVGGRGKWYDVGVSRRAEPSPGVRDVSFPLEAKKEHAMKRTMFALACAAVCVAGAGPINSVDFEGYTKAGPLLSNGYDDNGGTAGSPYFVYTGSSNSEDGSTVAAHEKEDASTGWEAKSFGSKYLSLSTEGGTLWRSILSAVQTPEEKDGEGNVTKPSEWTTGAATEIPDSGLYIDTMVQFTPTEDGSGLDDLGDDAKLAIWLNVTEGETNLCVRGGMFTGNDAESATYVQSTFTLGTSDGKGADVLPGKWYRLTVKALKLWSLEGAAWTTGFQIWLDGVELILSEQPFAAYETYFDTPSFPDSFSSQEAFEAVVNKKVVLGLTPESVGGYGEVSLSAVGFKGSGAIDDFCVTDEEPSFTAAAVTTVDFVLTWGEGVSGVTYTIEGETSQSATKDAVIKVDPDTKVTVAATPADWYTIADGIGEFTVTQNTTNTITATLSTMNDLHIGGFPANTSVSTTDVKKWADEKSISLSALQSSSYAYNSFLLNTGLLTADPVLTIDDVTVADGKMTITVAAKTSSAEDASAINLENIYGVLHVKTGATLDDMKSTEVPFIVKQGDEKNEDGKLTVTLDVGKFAQVKIGAKPTSAE